MTTLTLHHLEDRIGDSEKEIVDLKLIVSTMGTEINGLKKDIANRVSYKMFHLFKVR